MGTSRIDPARILVPAMPVVAGALASGQLRA
jgi:hypothetical protein